MKKLSLLLGTLGGAFAGYLLSNQKLRDELAKTKDAESAAQTLGKHLQHDGKKLAKQVQDFVQSKEIQDQLKQAKSFASDKLTQAKKELMGMAKEGKKQAVKTATKEVKKAQKAVKSAARKIKMKTKTLS